MKTVKDVSRMTGISIRTLRYYDEIGLLKPAKLTDAGYRLYDSRALERLQEIMFFRELEIPLEDIKKIMENPLLDKNFKRIFLHTRNVQEMKRNMLWWQSWQKRRTISTVKARQGIWRRSYSGIMEFKNRRRSI